MTDTQTVALIAASLVAAVLTSIGYLRGKRVKMREYESALAHAHQRKALPMSPCNVVLRDALYLCRRHLEGSPTSRRQSHLPHRSWQRAVLMARQAGLVDAQGKWHVASYPEALGRLQRVCRERAELERKGQFVTPW